MATSSAASVRRYYAEDACVPLRNAIDAGRSSSTPVTMSDARASSASNTPPPRGANVNLRADGRRMGALNP